MNRKRLKIRERVRYGYAREAQGYIQWTEYQIVDGNKVIARFDFRSHAEAFLALMVSAPPREVKPASGLSLGAQRHIQKWLDRQKEKHHG